jgi:hypothetical protein
MAAGRLAASSLAVARMTLSGEKARMRASPL